MNASGGIVIPALIISAWLLIVSAIIKPRQEAIIVALGVMAVLLALGGDPLVLIVLVLIGGGALLVTFAQRRRVSPSLDELAMMSEYLAHQLVSGTNLSQALFEAGQEASRTPPTLPLPVLGSHLRRLAKMMETGGVPESDMLRALGDQFDDVTTRSFFTFLASVAQNVSQDGLSEALESMSMRVKEYRDMQQSFESRLSMARTTRYVMLVLVPVLFFFIANSPIMEGGLLNNPLGIPLVIFNVILLGIAMLVGNWLSRIDKLEF